MLDVHSRGPGKEGKSGACARWVFVRDRGGEAEGTREVGAVPAASLDSMSRSEKARVLDKT